MPEKRVVLITGSSAGIGKACAEAFLALGDTVLLCGSSPKVFEVQEALQKKEGSKAILDAFQFDLRNPEEIYTAFEAIENRYHHLDVLVNNAGIARGGKIEEISLEDWNEMMAVNLSSCFLCCKYALPLMKPRNYGKIINVSSIAGRAKSSLTGVHYSTSKAAILGFTRQLAQELAPSGIRVNAVCPSQTRTAMLESFLNKDLEQRLKEKVPLGYIADPSDIAKVILFLASSASDYMTGAIVDVNGGQL